MRPVAGETQELTVDRRDQLLFDALAKIHEQVCTAPFKVAVVYGAGPVTTIILRA